MFWSNWREYASAQFIHLFEIFWYEFDSIFCCGTDEILLFVLGA